MKRLISVGMGELVVTAERDVDLVCLGLGSCIGVCGYDPIRRVGAMMHVVLPSATGRDRDAVTRYADTAIPELCQQLLHRGVRKENLRLVLCGGAAIFPPFQGGMDIGARNIDAVHAALRAARLSPQKEAIGGTESRTVILAVDSGIVRLRTVKDGEREFARLGEAR